MSVLNFKVENHIAHLEMNRPEAMNALNTELNQGLADAWRRSRRTTTSGWRFSVRTRTAAPSPRGWTSRSARR